MKIFQTLIMGYCNTFIATQMLCEEIMRCFLKEKHRLANVLFSDMVPLEESRRLHIDSVVQI